MQESYTTRIATFTEADLPTLDEVVLGALEFLGTTPLTGIDVRAYERPLVAGSVNALSTGKLLFRDTKAYFSEEATVGSAIKRYRPDALYLMSASGGKHALTIAHQAVEAGIPTMLLTAQEHAPAIALVGRAHTTVYPHLREPYTYNTSTYLAMLFGQGEEDPRAVLRWIEEVVAPALEGESFGDASAFFMTLPGELGEVRAMLRTKFDELFGPHVVGRVFTHEEGLHAKTVVMSDRERFIHFGSTPPLSHGRPPLTIPLPDGCGPAGLIAISYYVVGRIQRAHHPWFMERIAKYTREASAFFGEPIPVIVP